MKKNKDTKTIVILDAHAIIHRAYHALPAFSNSQGIPTGALYGVTSMVLKIIEDLKPDYIVAAYDLPKPTFRHHVYADYKAGRIKADEDLIAQLKSSRGLLESFNIPVLDSEGFEADDIIGTLVEQYKKEKNLRVIIASGDMDTLQLVDDKKVCVFTLKKGITDTILYDEEAVIERYGFKPKQLIDYKGLRGDPSDNIIGVPGVGEKTATMIIQKFGSIEDFYKNLEKNNLGDIKLSPRIIEILREHKDDAFFSKTLATIRRDAPIKFDLPKVDYRSSVDEKTVLDTVSEYEFRSLLPRIRKIFSFEEEKKEENIDSELLRKTSIAMWVLNSEKTNPSYEDILERTKKKTLNEAFDFIIEELKKKEVIDVFEKIEEPLIPVVSKMEKQGILIDKDHFIKLQTKMKKRLLEIEDEVSKITKQETNLNSPKQLSNLLFNILGLKPKGKQKESGAYTTNAETLESLLGEHPVISLILEHRETQKLLSTYVEALLSHTQDDGRVHATFLQQGTTTGRFSSTNPNLQNIPIKNEAGKEIRHGFIAPEGSVFLSSDYSQIELRVLAILSGDEALRSTFERGDDIHTAVASTVFKVKPQDVTSEMRRNAKVINFGIIYGMGVTALQKNLNTTRVEAQKFYNDYFLAFPTIAAYLEKTKEDAKKLGYTETLFGRKRYFPGIRSGVPFLRAMAERMATNAPLQGTAADIIKIAIVLADKDLKEAGLEDSVRLVLQVHDELVYEVKDNVLEKAEKIIISAMNSVFTRSPIKIPKITIPLAVSTGYGKRLDETK